MKDEHQTAINLELFQYVYLHKAFRFLHVDFLYQSPTTIPIEPTIVFLQPTCLCKVSNFDDKNLPFPSTFEHIMHFTNDI